MYRQDTQDTRDTMYGLDTMYTLDTRDSSNYRFVG